MSGAGGAFALAAGMSTVRPPLSGCSTGGGPLPGPALCAVLADLTPARLADDAVVDALQAWRRLRSYVDAQESAMTAEVDRCDPAAAARLAEPDPECGREIATALTPTELTAWREHASAEMPVYRLPDVHAALPGSDLRRRRRPGRWTGPGVGSSSELVRR